MGEKGRKGAPVEGLLVQRRRGMRANAVSGL